MSDDAVDYSGTIIIYNMACHSIAQLIMSDLQTSMGDDILQMTVCLRVRDGKEAVGQLKAIYPDEAKNAELDITATSTLKVR